MATITATSTPMTVPNAAVLQADTRGSPILSAVLLDTSYVWLRGRGSVLVGVSVVLVSVARVELSHDAVVAGGQVAAGESAGSTVGQSHDLVVTVTSELVVSVVGLVGLSVVNGGGSELAVEHWPWSSLYSCSYVRHTTPRSMEWSHDPSVISLQDRPPSADALQLPIG